MPPDSVPPACPSRCSRALTRPAGTVMPYALPNSDWLCGQISSTFVAPPPLTDADIASPFGSPNVRSPRSPEPPVLSTSVTVGANASPVFKPPGRSKLKCPWPFRKSRLKDCGPIGMLITRRLL